MGIRARTFGISSMEEGDVLKLISCWMRPLHSLHDSDLALACRARTTSLRYIGTISMEKGGKTGEKALQQGTCRCQGDQEASSYHMLAVSPSAGHHIC